MLQVWLITQSSNVGNTAFSFRGRYIFTLNQFTMSLPAYVAGNRQKQSSVVCKLKTTYSVEWKKLLQMASLESN